MKNTNTNATEDVDIVVNNFLEALETKNYSVISNLLAEDIVTKTIKREMENKEHYKVIFEKCKISLENFANSLMISK